MAVTDNIKKAQEARNKKKLSSLVLGDALEMMTYKTETLKFEDRGKVVQILTAHDFLPMPQNVEVAYPKNWAGKETTGFTFDKTALRQVGVELAKGAARFGETIFPDRAVAQGQYQSGMSVYDNKKLLFEGLDFRQFQFSLLFQPNNPAEQADVQNWITRVKIDSAPDLVLGDAFYKYPDFFQLSWPKLDNLFVTGPLALTNITVNYTPEGLWSENTDEMPTATRVNLSFTEIDLPVKDKIEGGW
jgi:hypothetical protein